MADLVERIVREVMARLAAAPRDAAPSPTVEKREKQPQPDEPKKPQPAKRVDDELSLAGRVVTLAELDGRLGSIRRLIVPTKAIVTPAVRDELQRRNIALSYAPANGEAKTHGPTAALQLLAIVHAGCCDAAAAGQSLSNIEAVATVETDDCVIAASDRLAAAVREPNTLGAMLTKYASAAMCLLNRLPQVRAIEGVDPARVSADAASVGANVLVVDPSAAGLHRARRLLAEFCRGGVRRCPSVFGSRLN